MWRQPSEYEKQILTKYYQTKTNILKIFLTIWQCIGLFSIIISQSTIIQQLAKKDWTALFGITAIIVSYFAFIKFPKWLLSKVIMRELNSIKNNTMTVCEAQVLDKQKTQTKRNNHYYTSYKICVNIFLLNTWQTVWLRTNILTYQALQQDDTVLVICPEQNKKEYMTVYDVNLKYITSSQ